jgi:hypothetical protein
MISRLAVVVIALPIQGDDRGMFRSPLKTAYLTAQWRAAQFPEACRSIAAAQV